MPGFCDIEKKKTEIKINIFKTCSNHHSDLKPPKLSSDHNTIYPTCVWLIRRKLNFLVRIPKSMFVAKNTASPKESVKRRGGIMPSGYFSSAGPEGFGKVERIMKRISGWCNKQKTKQNKNTNKTNKQKIFWEKLTKKPELSGGLIRGPYIHGVYTVYIYIYVTHGVTYWIASHNSWQHFLSSRDDLTPSRVTYASDLRPRLRGPSGAARRPAASQLSRTEWHISDVGV